MKLQQGDVILHKINGLPKGAKLLSHKTLAIGESTGSRHEIVWVDAGLYELDGILYAHNPSNKVSFQDHPQHGTLVIEKKSTYRIGTKREYDPFEEEIRKIMD